MTALPSVVVVTTIPSPYQVELFDALHAFGLDLQVIYLSGSEAGRQWQPRAAAHRHVILEQRSGLEQDELVQGAGLMVFATYRDRRVQRWLEARARSARPWCFWGERPGARSTGRLGAWYRRWRLQALHRSRAPVWGIGRFAVEGYAHEFGAARLLLNVPYFSDLARFAQPAAEPEPEPEPERSAGAPRVLYSGSLIERKGVDLLASAAARLGRTHAAFELHWLGSGALESRLRRTAVADGIPMVFHGFCDWDALPAHYWQADCLVAPSRYDGWGMIIPEAMAAGLPVLASDRMGAALELIEPGVNGWLVRAGDPASLEHGLREMLSRSRGQLLCMGRAARERVATHQLQDGVRVFVDAVQRSVQSFGARDAA